jgi:hypothetical protein
VFESLPICGFRLIETIKSDVGEHEGGVRDGMVRIQTDCLSAFFVKEAIAQARRTNDYLAENIAKNPKRLKGFCDTAVTGS